MLWLQNRVVPALELLCPLGLGKKELVQFVNRLGHGLSYHQLEENETGLCRKKISSISARSIPLPQYIQPYSFPTLAFDNIDMLEETLTEKGTIFRVNGIIVKWDIYDPLPEKPQSRPVEKKNKACW